MIRGTSRHLPCGDGDGDIAAALATLKEGGFTGWIMIDEWKIPDPFLCRGQYEARDKNLDGLGSPSFGLTARLDDEGDGAGTD